MQTKTLQYGVLHFSRVKTAAAAWGRKTRDTEGRQQAQTTTDSPSALVSGTPDWSNRWFSAWLRGAVWVI